MTEKKALSRRVFVKGAAASAGAVALGMARPSAAGAQASNGSCAADAWPEHGIYDATIVYGVDEKVSGSPFLPMNPERDTLAYRSEAYDFFRQRYGIDFDPEVVGDQFADDGVGGTVLVQAIKTGEGSTHQVYALDAQQIPQWRGKFPLTSVAFRDDGYFVFVLSDFIAHGSYGGDDGQRVRAGDLLVQGEYRMFDGTDQLMDTISYFADTPATVNPFNGDVDASEGANFVSITCRVESPLLGTGLTRGIGEMRPLAGDMMDLDFRYVMRFPSRLGSASIERPKCDTVKALR